MQILRRMTFLARLVLAGLLLSLGVAAASPAVKPRPLELVCSDGVFKLVAPGAAGMGPAASALDCPQCLPAGVPPAAAFAWVPSQWGGAVLPQCPPGVGPCVCAALLPPARAPPVASA